MDTVTPSNNNQHFEACFALLDLKHDLDKRIQDRVWCRRGIADASGLVSRTHDDIPSEKGGSVAGDEK